MHSNGNLSEHNPLLHLIRQPKIYIRLPSRGEFWPDGSLLMPESGELPVFSMTAKDEMMLKIPDALMNGQAVVDVIEHCVPNIKNAWHIPSIDIDAILIAIRLATYGELMTTPVSLGQDLDFEYQVDLRIVLDNIMQSVSWDPVVPVNEHLTLFVKPVSYKQISKMAIQSFETQKIMSVVNNEEIDEEEKVKIFKQSFGKLTEVTVGQIAESVYRVDSVEGTTENPQFIKEFIENADKEIFNRVQKHIELMKMQNELKPLIVPVTEEMKSKGITSETIEVPLIFDPSTFFV